MNRVERGRGADVGSGEAEHAAPGEHRRQHSLTSVPATGDSEARRPLRLLRFPAVRQMTGLSRSTIWRLERAAEFPRHVRLSANTVAWAEDEVLNWIQRKLA